MSLFFFFYFICRQQDYSLCTKQVMIKPKTKRIKGIQNPVFHMPWLPNTCTQTTLSGTILMKCNNADQLSSTNEVLIHGADEPTYHPTVIIRGGQHSKFQRNNSHEDSLCELMYKLKKGLSLHIYHSISNTNIFISIFSPLLPDKF